MSRLRERLLDQSGVSLVEILIATSLGTVVLFATVAFADRSVRNTARVQERVDMTQRTRAALGRIVTSLRTMSCAGVVHSPIIAASPTSLSFFAHRADSQGRPLDPNTVEPGTADARKIEINQSTGTVRQQIVAGVRPNQMLSTPGYYDYYGHPYSEPSWAAGGWRTLATGLARNSTLTFGYSGANYYGYSYPATIATVQITTAASGKTGFRPLPETLKLTQEVRVAPDSFYGPDPLSSACA